jgi:predicted phage replisome organizer
MKDGSAPWIKVVTRIFEDPKIIAIEELPEGSGVIILWFKLLTLAGEQNRGGAVYFTEALPFTAELLAAKWRCKPALVQMALGVFQKFGMVGIDNEGTIWILSWSKYQNEAGLAQIRERSLKQLEDRSTESAEETRARKRERDAERQRRWRRNQKKDGPNGNVTRKALRGVTGCVTVTPENDVAPREIVTPQIETKTKTKKEKENRSSLSLNKSEQDDLIQHAEAKQRLGKLSEVAFGEPIRENQWPAQWEYWLDEVLPMKRDNLELIEWCYGLSPDHKLFKVTRRRQSMAAVIEHLRSEPQKIRTARKVIGLNGLHDKPVERPEDADLMPEQIAAAQKLYGADIPLPAKWGQLAPSTREEITAAIANQSGKETEANRGRTSVAA